MPDGVEVQSSNALRVGNTCRILSSYRRNNRTPTSVIETTLATTQLVKMASPRTSPR